MKILKWKSGYAHKEYIVLLEGSEVDKMPDILLITMADRGGRPLEPTTAARILENAGPANTGHFGGLVEKRPGRVDGSKMYARIKVYTD